jgi:hypothetical protein
VELIDTTLVEGGIELDEEFEEAELLKLFVLLLVIDDVSS